MSEDTQSPGVALVQLGCEKNTIDGERILGELNTGGYEFFTLAQGHELFDSSPNNSGKFVSFQGEVRDSIDLMLVNTCAFIGPAREESINAIFDAAELKRSGAVRQLGIAGCLAQTIHDELTDELRDDIDFFMGPGDISRALDIIDGERPYFRPDSKSLEPGPRVLSRLSRTAYIKIAEGCDKNCSFCTIPSFKGKFLSKPSDLILDEIRALVGVGTKEIVLVSQDTVMWGTDLQTKAGKTTGLSDLIASIQKLADSEDGFDDFRLRIHYLYPSQVTEQMIAAIFESRSVANYFDIPIQHASSKVLKSMNRPPNPDAIRNLVSRIRNYGEESALRTTVMTGHPSEDDADFGILLDFLQDVPFDRLGVFAYSPEEGTPSFAMSDRAGEEIARERAGAVMDQQRKISAERLAGRVGRSYDVIIDEPGIGRSELEAPDVDGVIHIEGSDLQVGSFARVKVTGSDDHDLFGEREEEQ